MRSAARILFCLLLIVFATATHAQQVFKTTQPSTIAYYEYLPQDYNSNSDKYPVMIFLHGIGERGPNTTDVAKLQASIYEVAKLGPPMYVKNGTQFPFILISPQLKDNYGTWPSSYVMEVINHVKTYLRIDERRIYLTGLSLGGGGTWVAAQDYPELFAAIAPVCGGYNSPSKACGIASENVAVWAFHGDIDSTVPMSRSVNMVNAINACTPAPSPLAKMTIYTGVNHNAWSKAYKTDNSVHTPNVYQWITSFTNTVKKGTKVPVANAGSDKNIAPGSVALTGSGTDSDGSIASYAWKQISGPNTSTLSTSTSASLTISNLVDGTYTFRLTVTDNVGITDSDYVKINVSSTYANVLPAVNAGADKSITLPASTTSFTATASDSDGTIASYAWTKVSGPGVTLAGTTSSILSCSALTEGSYVFRATVTDNSGGTKSDDVALTVNPVPNSFPSVNAGADRSLTLPLNSVSLTASATDTDGSILSYSWSKVSGGTVTLAGTATSTLAASGMIEGSYTFRVTVADDDGAQKSDDVVVVVNAATSNNIAPVAKAGLDKTITLPTKAITIVGAATDADGTIASYSWTKVSGPAASMNNVTTPKLWAYNLVQGIYSFRLTVTDNNGATSSDDMLLTVQGESAATSFPNVAPVANAGGDKTVNLPTTSFTIVGQGTDTDGTIASYNWTKLSGPSVTLANSTTSSLFCSSLIEGTYDFRLTVKDDKGAIHYDDMKLVVAPVPVTNVAPTVSAGSDKTITLPTKAITIVGTASDPDGTIASYLWTKISGPAAPMSNTTTSKLWAYNLTVGTYIFRLTVKDNNGVSKYDEMKLVVQNPTTTTASFQSEEITIEEINTNEEKVLGNLSMTQLENATVIVFNETGKQIYSGNWSSTSQKEVMNHNGLYIYNVIRQGKRSETGKIYIR
jgi:dienelactone hydrolase